MFEVILRNNETGIEKVVRTYDKEVKSEHEASKLNDEHRDTCMLAWSRKQKKV